MMARMVLPESRRVSISSTDCHVVELLAMTWSNGAAGLKLSSGVSSASRSSLADLAENVTKSLAA